MDSASVSTGSSKCRSTSATPPSPTLETPLAGSQCKVCANTRIKISASQNTGTDTPASARVLTAPSSHPPGRSAASVPSARDSSTARVKPPSISLVVCHSAGPITSSTGRAWTRL